VKVVISFLLVVFSASISYQQSTVPPQKGTGPEVVKFSWSKERIGWERDPFLGPVENFDEMRSRVRNEKRVDDAKRGGNSTGADQVRREARADAANLARQRESKSTPRYMFMYKARVKNNDMTAIVTIDWDYIFLERGTENEVGRQQFTSEEQIGPGKTKELVVTLNSPPSHTISVTSLNKDENEQLTGKVVLVRVKYADGRIWPAP